MNPEEHDEIFFEGDKLEDAIKGYSRKVEGYYIFGEEDNICEPGYVFEDIDEQVFE